MWLTSKDGALQICPCNSTNLMQGTVDELHNSPNWGTQEFILASNVQRAIIRSNMTNYFQVKLCADTNPEINWEVHKAI